MSLPHPDTVPALSLALQLMPIRGKSGEERPVAEFIIDRLRSAGLPDDCIEFDDANKRTVIPGEIGNLIVKLPGTMRGPRRLLTAHMDTVPICVGSRPVRKGDHISSANAATTSSTWASACSRTCSSRRKRAFPA